MNDSKMLDMTCPNCDGQMEYSVDEQMLICPYCDTKIMLTESDEVKIEKIRSERFKMQREASMNVVKKDKKRSKPKFWLVCTIIAFLATIVSLTTDSYFSENLLLILMTISFVATWICILNGYLDKKKNWMTVLKLVPWIFFILFVVVETQISMDADVQEYDYYSEEVIEIDEMALLDEDEDDYQLNSDDKKLFYISKDNSLGYIDISSQKNVYLCNLPDGYDFPKSTSVTASPVTVPSCPIRRTVPTSFTGVRSIRPPTFNTSTKFLYCLFN